MGKEIKYYLIFDSLFNKQLNGCWAEIIVDKDSYYYNDKQYILNSLRKYYKIGDYLTEKQICDEIKFKIRREKMPKNAKCYEKIYLPIPGEISIESHDPFFTSKKKPRSTGEIRRMKKYNLSQLMKKRGVTLHDIHKATGVSYPALTGIRNGTLKGRIRTMRDIASYLNIDVRDLI